MIVRHGQLGPHDRGFDAPDHQEEYSVTEVHQAQLLVIDRDDPFVHAIEKRASYRFARRYEHGSRN